MVATESWRRHHLLAYSEPRDEEERKSKCHNKQEGTLQLPAHHSLPGHKTDSAIYFCAVETQSSAGIWNLYPNSEAERHHLFSSLSFHIHLSLSSDWWDSFDQLKYIPNDAFQKLFKFKIYPLQATPITKAPSPSMLTRTIYDLLHRK